MKLSLPSTPAVLLLSITSAIAQSTNLPDVPPGVFNVSARIEIEHTSLALAWDALTDFPTYPKSVPIPHIHTLNPHPVHPY
jgi:hypothetical protein